MAITYRNNFMGPIAVSWYRKRGLVEWVSKKVDAEIAAQVCDLEVGDTYQVEEYTERYCGGRIDIYGLPEEEFYNGRGEYSVEPMHHKDWEALGNWLYTFQTTTLWSYDKLIKRFEGWYDKKIRWASDHWAECSFCREINRHAEGCKSKEQKVETKYLLVEADGWLTDEGVEISVYIGNTDDPQVEVTHPYEKMIDQNLEAYLVEGKIAELHKDEAARFVAKIEEMYKYAKKRAKELGL